MKDPCRLWLLLVGISLAVTAEQARAQSAPGEGESQKLSRSHNLEKLTLPGDDPEEQMNGLRERRFVQLLKKRGATSEQVAKLKQNPELFDILQSLDLNDAKVLEQLQQMSRHPLDERGMQKGIEELRKLASAEEKPDGESAPADASQPAPDMGRVGPGMASGDVGSSSGETTPQDNSITSQASSPWSDRIMRFMDRLDPNWRSSVPLQQALGDLRNAERKDPRWDELTARARALDETWGQWGQMLHLERFGPKEGLSWLPGWASRVRFPERAARIVPRTPSPAPGPPNPGRWQGFIGIAGLVLLAFVLLKTWARFGGAGKRATDSAWRLGPWPVDPARVGSREDLIRAFEYLSLLVFGPEARTWNHRFIADQLGAGQPEHVSETLKSQFQTPFPAVLERRRAAEALAGLYEQARYAPPTDLLPDHVWTSARSDLRLLAGVTAA